MKHLKNVSKSHSPGVAEVKSISACIDFVVNGGPIIAPPGQESFFDCLKCEVGLGSCKVV